jgi:hypothetical protein
MPSNPLNQRVYRSGIGTVGREKLPAAALNAAEMLQRGPQQKARVRGSGSGLERRKFRCVFKGSGGK